MISLKLKTILLISIPLFALHGLEEYFFKFYLLDPSFAWVGNIFNYTPATIFLAEQVLGLFLLLLTIYKPHKVLLVIVGLIFIIEVSHPMIAIFSHLYAGLFTSIPLIFLGILYWKNFLSRE
jgi:hypothetical protein